MKQSWCVWIVVAVCAGCGDGYTPPAGGTVIIDDNNMMTPAGSAEVAVGFPSGPLLEGGMPVTVTVALKLPPTAPVTVALSSSDEAAGTVSPATLTFDMASWATPQTVTLTPVDDEVATGDKPWELRFELTSDDPNLAGKPVSPLKLNTIDNDAAPTIVATVQGAPQTTEAGGAATISVQLSRQPKSDVLIPIALSDPAEADLSALSMTFTTLNWNLPQQLVATGKDDMLKDGDKQYKAILGAANSADEEFNGIGPAEVTLTNIDGVCGNGAVDGAEGCEPDGRTECEFGQMDCMVCNNSCQLVPGNVTGFCGDGVTQFENAEECDEPTAPCAYGEETCQACSGQCTLIPGVPAGRCGDGTIQAQFEQCDAPTAPCPYGQMSCMTCRNCQNTPGQVMGYCGDGQVQAASGEECDGAATMACPAGTIGDTTCLATCKFTAACSAPIAAGSGFYHSCAIFQNGTMRCWGSSDGNPGGLNPNLVAGAVTVKQMVGGNGHTCFLMANETVRCMGDGYYGQLGTGSTADRTTPATVIGVTGAKQLTAGEEFTCALLSNGTVKCWGDGYQGQLGDGQSSPSSTPVVVAGLSNVTSIAAGFSHACATRTDGSVRCWGSGYEGQLGDGRSTSADVIVAVSSITNAKAVAAHQNQTCALLTTGQVRCWGWNGWGQLGDGSQSNRPTPAPAISGLSGVEQVVMGGFHTCARLTEGSVKCWGGGDTGQLGDGTTTYNRYIPSTAVTGISSAVDITAGRAHTCAVLQTGETRCWGGNSSYQLGTKMFVQYSATPLPVEF